MAPEPELLTPRASPIARLRSLFSQEKDDPFMFSADAVDPRDTWARLGSAPAEPRQWHGFELADLMEEGTGPGLATQYAEPASDDREADERLLVKVGQTPGCFTLTTEQGQPLLHTRPSDKCPGGFDIFLTSSNESKTSRTQALGPSFQLECNESMNKWTLYSSRCPCCEAKGARHCGARMLSTMSQYFEKVGEGQAFCMDVELSGTDEDGSPGSCPRRKMCTAQTTQGQPHKLTTLRPKWNQAHKSLALNFYGRVSMASAKNFQLQQRDRPCEPGRPNLLFGQVAEDTFVLDYHHPFGVVQALAAALTTSHWL